MDASLALYRRYRPDTYVDVLGQEHVTEPLRQALRNNRVNHAYLFSGPRGCGKTTSARILARCLNCDQGPTPDPCGECQSCRDLARGGPGSIDVIEIDAASHGGVDDARDLRERAFFAPVSARYKIYIVDEAHMVTTQGFNALLKLVEEPPDHLKFIFATTEPDKVIGTIRSRTHHYPFRLVPPKLLQDYLAELCEREDVRIDPAALPLVVRAGAGSVRDTLSVLDQLLGGAGEDGVSYQHAVSLLGYTPDSLLDDAVEALAARDGSTMFGTVDKVIESGQDPKRFGEDLLRRLRDLVVVSAVPDAAERGLIDGSPEMSEQLAAQAGRFGAAELTRAADVLHEGLTEMRGATAPRLQLELICARMLLPDATDSELGLHARLERLETAVRSGNVSSGPASPTSAAPAQAAQPAPAQAAPAQAAQPAPAQPAPAQAGPAPGGQPPSAAPATSAPPEAPAPAESQPAESQPAQSQPAQSPPDEPPADPWASMPAVGSSETAAASAPVTPTSGSASAGSTQPAPGVAAASGGSGVGFNEVRQRWEQILDAVARRRRFTWIVLSQNGHLVDVDQHTVTVGFVNAGARDSFSRGGSDEIVQQALSDVLGGTWRVEAVVDPGGGGSALRGGGSPDPASGAAPLASPPSSSPPSGAAPPGGASPSSDTANSPNGTGGPSGTGGMSSAPSAAAGATTAAAPASSTAVVDGHASAPGNGVVSTEWPETVRVPNTQAETATEVAASPQTADPAQPGAAAQPGSPEQPSARQRAFEAARSLPSENSASPASEPDHAASSPDDEVDPETDEAATGDPVSQVDLLVRELGAQIIEEQPNR